MKKIFGIFVLMMISINMVSSIGVTRVLVDEISPGGQATILMDMENFLNEDAEAVSINLIFTNTPFTPVGSSEDSVDEIRTGKEKSFSFTIRASNDIVPGDYEIPYQISYEIDGERKIRNGSVGIKVIADSELSFSLSAKNPVIGQQGQINLRVTNKGLADARFLSIRLLPEGYTLLSEDEIYIGTVDSDDFENANFDVIFGEKPKLNAIIDYMDFNNNRIVQNVNLPVNVFTKQRAEELGIIEKSNVVLYLGIVTILVILWIVWRIIKKRRRRTKSKAGA